jgi:hypothetical protein
MIGIGENNFCFCRSAQGFAKLFFSRSGFNPYPAPRNRVVCAHLTKSVFKVSDDAFFKLQSKETKIGVQRRFPPPRYSRAESATANTVPCGDLPGRGHNAEYSDVNNLRGTIAEISLHQRTRARHRTTTGSLALRLLGNCSWLCGTALQMLIAYHQCSCARYADKSADRLKIRS